MMLLYIVMNETRSPDNVRTFNLSLYVLFVPVFLMIYLLYSIFSPVRLLSPRGLVIILLGEIRIPFIQWESLFGP